MLAADGGAAERPVPRRPHAVPRLRNLMELIDGEWITVGPSVSHQDQEGNNEIIANDYIFLRIFKFELTN